MSHKSALAMVQPLRAGRPLTPHVRTVMRANRSRDSKPEARLRRLFFGAGLRYRVNYPVRLETRPVRVDIAFPRRRLAVFVDGCFWHACPTHGNAPRHNHEYWSVKLRRNVERDRRVDAELEASGWRVLRIWEHV